jgi:hypothetical protein
MDKKTYLVTVKEIWNQMVEVQAVSEEDAIVRIQNGEGNYLSGMSGFEYNHTLDFDTWSVELRE